MEIGPVMRPLALDAVMPVAPVAAEPLEPEGPAAAAPGQPAGQGLQSAVLQTFARPHAGVPVVAAETPRGADSLSAGPPLPASAQPLAAEPLVPATLIALHVDAAAAWPLQRHAAEGALPAPAQARAGPQRTRVPRDGRGSGRDGDAAPAPEPPAEPAPDRRDDAAATGGDPSAGLVFDDPDAGDWCTPLTAALRRALAARAVPQALLAAAEQWRRGRCVVLACPQGADPAGPGWAFVLWPQRPARGATGRAALLLRGLRVEARLQWSAPPDPGRWCHARVVKEHHPRRGRQLVPLAGTDGDAPACDVQLGPVLARPLRGCEVRVRIDAVRRFWAALGTQWSATVVVGARPLAAGDAWAAEEKTC